MVAFQNIQTMIIGASTYRSVQEYLHLVGMQVQISKMDLVWYIHQL
jgi:hypothetical protein